MSDRTGAARSVRGSMLSTHIQVEFSSCPLLAKLQRVNTCGYLHARVWLWKGLPWKFMSQDGPESLTSGGFGLLFMAVTLGVSSGYSPVFFFFNPLRVSFFHSDLWELFINLRLLIH